MPSPLLYRGSVYFLKVNSGILTSLDAKTGAVRFTERLTESPTSTRRRSAPTAGSTSSGAKARPAVLEAGPTAEGAGHERPDDATDTSPALVDGELYLRGAKNLYRISAN